MKSQDVIDGAVNALETQVGIKAKYLPNEKKEAGIILILEKDSHEYPFEIEVKANVTKAMIPLLTNSGKINKNGWLLISQYIPSTIKAQLRSAKVNYLEMAGNCFIDVPGLFIHINDQKVTPIREKPGKLWRETGLKFLFAILTDEDLINQPYREIAEKAEVSLGAVSGLVKELKGSGFATEALRFGKQVLLLEHKDNLIDQWAIVDNSILRPKLSYGKFKSTLQIDGASLGDDDNYWGGEMAAVFIVRGFVAQDLTIYTWQRQYDIMNKFKLIPSETGNLEIVNGFWPKHFNRQNKGHQCVPNLIIYADLLNSNDSRNREIAAKLKARMLT